MDTKLLEDLQSLLKHILETTKRRMGIDIDPSVFDRISDAERNKWYKVAQNATSEFKQLYAIYRGIGYPHTRAHQLAYDTLKKEKQAGVGELEEPDVHASKEPEAHEDPHSYRELGYHLIKSIKDKFPNDADALKILTLHLIRGFPQDPDNVTFDEFIPHKDIPYYEEVSKVLKRGEDATAYYQDYDPETKEPKFTMVKGKKKPVMVGNPMAWKGGTVLNMIKDPPPDGLGITGSHYYKVRDYLGKIIREYIAAADDEGWVKEAFFSNVMKVFGDKEEKVFKLSNLEPLEQIVKRDMGSNKYKNYGIHVQGLLTSEGEDVIKDSQLHSIKHVFDGDVVLTPVTQDNIGTALKKAIPGKKVILFGFDSASKPIGKGWEKFQYRVATDPMLLGVYRIADSSKSESLLRAMSNFLDV